jgi:hypothetical protein
MKTNPNTFLKFAFIYGAILDWLVAISWFLIAFGLNIPNLLTGYTGTGSDYQMAMYIAGMFMGGWGIILAWGALKPTERRGILLITSVFLFLSVIVELVFWNKMFGGVGLIFGVAKRLFLVVMFTSAFFYSFKCKDKT